MRGWIFALTTLAAGTGAIHWLRIACLHWPALADAGISVLPACSVGVLLSSFLVRALATGLFEVAGYRSYPRGVLEKRYGPKAAIIASALFLRSRIYCADRFFLWRSPQGSLSWAARPKAALCGKTYPSLIGELGRGDALVSRGSLVFLLRPIGFT